MFGSLGVGPNVEDVDDSVVGSVMATKEGKSCENESVADL